MHDILTVRKCTRYTPSGAAEYKNRTTLHAEPRSKLDLIKIQQIQTSGLSTLSFSPGEKYHCASGKSCSVDALPPLRSRTCVRTSGLLS